MDGYIGYVILYLKKDHQESAANTLHGICLQQAQRLLWQGGVLGDKGEFALMTLDNELRERQFAWPDLRSLLAITGFLATFPAGPAIC